MFVNIATVRSEEMVPLEDLVMVPPRQMVRVAAIPRGEAWREGQERHQIVPILRHQRVKGAQLQGGRTRQTAAQPVDQGKCLRRLLLLIEGGVTQVPKQGRLMNLVVEALPGRLVFDKQIGQECHICMT